MSINTHTIGTETGMATTNWRRELAINLLGLATLVAVIVLGSYALRLDATPTATSVKAYALTQGVAYTDTANRNHYPRALTGGGSGGNGEFRPAVAAQQK